MTTKTSVVMCALAMAAAGCEGARSRPAGTPGAVRPTPDSGAAPAVDAGFDDAGRPIDAGATPDAGAIDGGGAVDGGAPPADGGGGGGDGPCPAHLGFEMGRSWTYRSTDAYEKQSGLRFTATNEVIQMADMGGSTQVVLRFTQSLTGNAGGQPYMAMTMGDTVYSCDAEGAWIVSSTTLSQGVTGETPFTSQSDTYYDPPYLSHVPDPASAGTWTATTRQVTEGVSNGQPFDNEATFTQTSRYVGRESYSVPAGTFDALRIEVDTGGQSSVGFYAEGVGFLGGDTQVLDRYR